ncbi:amidohydrolase family protein [Cupriavidus sp. PET2-C1]
MRQDNPYEASANAPYCLPPPRTFERATFDVPRLSCDTHAHVVATNPSSFPVVSARSYTPVPCPEEDYLAMLDANGLDRGVLVQISVYGTDNRYMLDVLRRNPDRLRGVGVVSPDVTERELRDMHEAGVRGLRLNVLYGGGVGLDAMETLAAKIEDMGWHLQLLLDARQLPELLPRLRKLTLPVVVDHMGHMPVALGRSQPGFEALKHLMTEHGWWTKLSGTYRISDQRPLYQDGAAWAQELVQAAPDQVVWGSDWPHVAVSEMPDAGHLLNLLATWVPDAEARSKILVSNPQRLYGFPPASSQ